MKQLWRANRTNVFPHFNMADEGNKGKCFFSSLCCWKTDHPSLLAIRLNFQKCWYINQGNCFLIPFFFLQIWEGQIYVDYSLSLVSVIFWRKNSRIVKIWDFFQRNEWSFSPFSTFALLTFTQNAVWVPQRWWWWWLVNLVNLMMMIYSFNEASFIHKLLSGYYLIPIENTMTRVSHSIYIYI